MLIAIRLRCALGQTQCNVCHDIVIAVSEHHTISMVAHTLNEYLRVHGHARCVKSATTELAPLTLAIRQPSSGNWVMLDTFDRVMHTPLHGGSDVLVTSWDGPPAGAVARRKVAGWLVVEHAAAGTSRYPIYLGHHRIGRSWDAHIRLVDRAIPRHLADVVISRLPQGVLGINIRSGQEPKAITVAPGQSVPVTLAIVHAYVISEPDTHPDGLHEASTSPCGSYESGLATQMHPDRLAQVHESTLPCPDQPQIQHLPRQDDGVEPQPRVLTQLELPVTSERSRTMMSGLFVSTGISAIVYVATGQQAMIPMMALSAAMSVGTWLEYLWQRVRDKRRRRAVFQDSLHAWRGDAERIRAQLFDELHTYAPDIAEAVTAAISHDPSVWSRHIDAKTVMRLTLGHAERSDLIRIESSHRTLDSGSREGAFVQLRAQQESHIRNMPECPIWLTIDEPIPLGILGPDQTVDEAITALIIQLVTWYSPTRVRVVMLDEAGTSVNWRWLAWLDIWRANQHAADRTQGSYFNNVEDLMAFLKDAVATYLREPTAAEPIQLVVIVRSIRPAYRTQLAGLAAQSATAKLFFIWCAEDHDGLPVLSRNILDLSDLDRPIYREQKAAFVLSARPSATKEQAELVVRSLGALEDVTRRDLANELPQVLTWRMMNSYEGSLKDQIAKNWRTASRGLASAFLCGREGPIEVSLRSDGPHALVAGTTGAGKSELLQAWVMSLAAQYSPDRVTFLLVDYKGGAAFSRCADLPHCVGVITDLDEDLVTRAVLSLRAELRYRERILAQYRVKDLAEFDELGATQALPALVIVIDEFASLVAEVPEFIDAVVDIAQRGRSLGLHLILATQRPAGVVSDNIRANTNLRIALRVADDADSLDVIDVSDAAKLDRSIPGRGYLRTSRSDLTMFQSLYLASRSLQASDVTKPLIMGTLEQLYSPVTRHAISVPANHKSAGAFDLTANVHTRELLQDAGLDTSQLHAANGHEQPRDIDHLVQALNQVAAEMGTTAPRRPWLEPLPHFLKYDETWLNSQCEHAGVCWGKIDQPSRQQQHELVWEPERGHGLVVGGSRRGKTTAIATLVVALSKVVCATGRICQIDIITANISEFAHLDGMPTVGNIIAAHDTELLDRLVDSLAQRSDITRFVLIDEVDRIDQINAESADGQLCSKLRGLAEARADCMYIFATARRPLPTFHPLHDLLITQVDLDDDRAPDIAGPTGNTLPVGRGRRPHALEGEYAQIAAVSGDEVLRQLGAQLAWIRNSIQVLRRLPHRITRHDLSELCKDAPSSISEAVIGWSKFPIGVNYRNLDLVYVNVLRGLNILGPDIQECHDLSNGVISQMADEIQNGLWLSADRKDLPPAGCGQWSVSATGMLDVTELLPSLSQTAQVSTQPIAAELAPLWEAPNLMANDTLDRSDPATSERGDLGGGLDVASFDCVVVRAAHGFAQSDCDEAITRLIRVSQQAEIPVIVTANLMSLSQAWELAGLIRSTRYGVLLRPNVNDASVPFAVNLPPTYRTSLPRGRGFLVDGDHATLTQFALD